ncbi:MAG: LemA family protein [Bacilli bacterium]|nr:LemA family protein [Bacilli bacterium]
MVWLWVTLAVIVLLGLFVATTYNSLVQLRNKVRDQWAQVDVQLKKRFDLVPNLVETVKGYAKHEKETFEKVIEARSKFSSARTPETEMEASGELSKALSRIMMLAESYPELKANQNFLKLQEELADVEEKIAYARQFYNDRVLSYMDKIQMFPSNVVASMFKFKEAKYFEAVAEEKEAPKVSFDK